MIVVVQERRDQEEHLPAALKPTDMAKRWPKEDQGSITQVLYSAPDLAWVVRYHEAVYIARTWPEARKALTHMHTGTAIQEFSYGEGA